MFLSTILSIISSFFGLFGYISQDKLYPEPLSKTEEEYYLRRYFKGDKEARNILIEHNLRLVVHIAKKYITNEQELEDYTSIGIIGLIKAIYSFKENKGFKISTYASRCIENEILMYIRSTKKNKAEISLNQVIGTDKDGNDMELLDILEQEDVDTVENLYNKSLLKDAQEFLRERLNKREKYILNSRYGLDGKKAKTQQEVANELGISRSYVSRIETKIQSLLRKNIQK